MIYLFRLGKTLSARRWHAAFTPEGYLDIGKILSRICRGGIHPSIRGEVWEFLLGCYDSKSTFDEREQLRQHRRVQYAALKEECRMMFHLIGSGRFISAPVITEDGDPILDPIVLQELNVAKEPTSVGPVGPSGGFEMVKEHDKRIIQWKLSLHQIGLDVIRTDRTLVFYEKQENLSKLWDILSVYAWFDRESVRMLAMKMVGAVFFPKKYKNETLGGGNYLFAFRMLMVLFRREFSFADSLYLWEMMWSLQYDLELFFMYEDPDLTAEKSGRANVKSIRQYGKYERENMRSGGKDAEAPLPISVFLVASVLKDKSAKLTEARGLDEVVKILNNITGNLDAKKACSSAMKLHKKYLKKATLIGSRAVNLTTISSHCSPRRYDKNLYSSFGLVEEH
ncbi:hypothetical protein HAX54_041542 [Datura stramonium]|uniref:Rab-GAP TBC domain-containing protein n=1 Tax=Datura stramonium TaxID=4076 RepID=A0ABS8RNK3_DATST|nr:hypothetical protein [Datura stramonium]